MNSVAPRRRRCLAAACVLLLASLVIWLANYLVLSAVPNPDDPTEVSFTFFKRQAELGNVAVAGRRSPRSLYRTAFATFEADTVYRQRDAEGFINLNALRLKIRSLRDRRP